MGTVAGLFETKDRAVKAVDALKSAGFSADDISIVMRESGEAIRDDEEANATAKTTTAAAVGGGLLGGLAGLALGTGVLVIPGLGPIVAAGTLAAVLTGGAIGAVTGEILTELAKAGISDEDAEHYRSGIEQGSILLSIRVPEGRESEAHDVLKRHGLHEPDARPLRPS